MTPALDEYGAQAGDRPALPFRRAPMLLPTRWVKLLVPAIYLACLFAFVTDMTHDNSLAYGIAYVPLICTAVFHRNPRAVWILAGIANVMVVLGYFFPVVNRDVLNSIGNRTLSVFAILVTAALVRYARDVQDRLAEQTSRAEAAERLKTEVFTNLSREIRTPLHAIIGFAELMIAGCRPDQRLPLGQMQMGGKRLLGTIDNLIDLTTLDRRVLESGCVDIAASLRQVAEQARGSAVERDITLAVEMADATALLARADPWAVQRILENVISNALKFTRPGGSVTMSAEASASGVAATVADTGVGMAFELMHDLSGPASADDVETMATGTGTGLTLSRRLAEAMGGMLLFESRPGRGTTVRLWLPAAAQASR